MSPELSIVIPVLDESAVIDALMERLLPCLNATSSWEICLVDDGSTDDSWAKILAWSQREPRIFGVSLSRNFGHQVAISAGLDHVRGDAVVIMDADLQDPPEVIPELIARWREGFDVVYAVRRTREAESLWKRASAALFYRGLRTLTKVDIPIDTGDFRLMSRRVVDSLRQFPERNRFVRGLVAWAGFRQTRVEYDRAPRHAGRTKYPLHRMVRLAGDAVASFSTLPLRLATGMGFTISILCVGYAFWAAYATWIHGRPVPGWASLMVVILLVGGVQLICLGVIGEYIGRIYDEVKRRPLYLVGDTCGSHIRREIAASSGKPSPVSVSLQ